MRKHTKAKGCLLLFILLIAGGAMLLRGKPERQEPEQTKKISAIPFQEVNVGEQELAPKYYYNQIGEDDKKVYKEIVEGIKTNTEEIYVHSADADRANTIFQYVLKDFPEIFWCGGAIKSTTYDDEDAYTIVAPDYIYSEEEKAGKKAEIETAVNTCLSGISSDASDYDKILYVYKYIVDTVDYEVDAPDNQNICSAFLNKKSVCAGYSRAAQYLLERLGVFCTYVTGITSANENHAWNLVKCNGDYYYVDVTWGDPVFQKTEGETQISDDFVSYDYMCCNDEQLFKTHTPDGDIPLPECTKMDANYYVVNGMYYAQYESEQILKEMNEVISKKGNPSVFKFSNNEIYSQASEDILGNQIKVAAQNLAQWYGLKEVRYQYMDEAELNKITIYWQYE